MNVLQSSNGVLEGLVDGPVSLDHLKHAEGLVAAATVTVGEIRQLDDALGGSQTRRRDVPGISALLRAAQTKQAHLQRAFQELCDLSKADGGQDDERLRLLAELRSLSFSLHARWDAVKRCSGLISTTCELPKQLVAEKGRSRRRPRGRKDAVMVDAVVDGGEEWLRILGTTEKALLMEMARSGWDWDVEEGEEEEEEEEDEEAAHHAYSDWEIGKEANTGSDAALGAFISPCEPDPESGCDSLCEINILRVARDLVTAARSNRPPYQANLRVHLLLPRVWEGRSPHIDRLLDQIRALGPGDSRITILVSCANSPFYTTPPPPFPAALAALLGQPQDDGDEAASLTATLNLDTSILACLVSDISHSRLTPAVAQGKKMLEDQIRAEAEASALVRDVYPALAGRRLVCTSMAAAHFAPLVALLGTDATRDRARLLLPPEHWHRLRESGESTAASAREQGVRRTAAMVNQGGVSQTQQALLEAWKTLTIHPVPDDLQLPIEVVSAPEEITDVPAAVNAGRLPPVAAAALAAQSELNRNMFAYGWADGFATLTANRLGARQILRAVEDGAGVKAARMLKPRIRVLPATRFVSAKIKPESEPKAVYRR